RELDGARIRILERPVVQDARALDRVRAVCPDGVRGLRGADAAADVEPLRVDVADRARRAPAPCADEVPDVDALLRRLRHRGRDAHALLDRVERLPVRVRRRGDDEYGDDPLGGLEGEEDALDPVLAPVAPLPTTVPPLALDGVRVRRLGAAGDAAPHGPKIGV